MSRPEEVAYVPAGRLLNEYQRYCEALGFPFHHHLSLVPPDPSTLFCIAGMQRYKPLFRDPSHRGTVCDVQRCIPARIDCDVDQIDGRVANARSGLEVDVVDAIRRGVPSAVGPCAGR